MILNKAARAAYTKAIALDTQIDARVIRADGSGTATTAATLEGLKDASEWAWAAYREEKDAMSEGNYNIDADKLVAVTEIVNAMTDPAATSDLIKLEICAGWNEDDATTALNHQRWIEDANPREIADWLATFYQESA